MLAASVAWSQSAPASQWVFVDSSGKLAYKTLPQGDHIMDFSWAGYMGGGVSLPTVPVQRTLNPSGGDDTSAIQAAINAVSALAPDANGFRGAVLLSAGTFHISGTVHINASGVVLRGSGSGNGGTVISMTGSTGFLAISVQGSGSYSTSNTANFTDSYVPSGVNTINVSSTSGFNVGDNVLITRTVTAAWVHFMGMDTLVRNGAPQTWLAVGTKITTDRVITAISGNSITIDAPLTDSFDSTFLGTPVGTIAKYTFAGRISQDGIEHLKMLAPAGTTAYGAVTMNNIIDAWVQDVVGQETQNAFNVDKNAKRVTLDHVINNISVVQTQAARTGDFSITGTEILVNQCQSNGTGDWPLVTSATGTGPIVILNFTSTENGGISPHQRWTTGILSDNGSLPNPPSGNPGIAYRDRGTDGSGHGWTSGWSVAWNVTTPDFLVQQPPGTENWCIGCMGTEVSASEPGGNGTLLPNGIFDSTGTMVTPSSLYLAQLCQRLGAAALANIGYSSSFCVTSQAMPDFSLSASPSSQTVIQGGSTSYTASVSPSNGFNSAVSLSVSGLPGGATGTFSPTSISGGSGSSTLSIVSSSTVATGTYTVTITGTGGGLSHSATATLVVNAPPDFSIAASPSSQTVIVGGSTSYTASVSPSNGFNSTVSLSISGLPSGATGTFSPTSISGGSGSSTLSVATSSTVAPGSYPLTITGTGGGVSHSATVTLVVNAPPDFSIAASPSSQTVTAGNGASYTASVSPINGFSSTVSLGVSGLPTGATGTFNPTSISGGSGSSTLSVATSSTVAAGTYPLTITGTSGGQSHSAAVTLVVNAPPPDFSLSASPSSQTVTAGNSTSYAVSTSALSGFSGSVGLSVSGLPGGATGTFNPTSISGAGSSTLNVTTTSSTAANTYTLTITGTSGSLTHTATVSLVVKSPVTTTKHEAEASGNTLSGAVVTATCSGCSGGQKVRFIGSNASNFLVINNISVPTAGTYTMVIFPVVSGTRTLFYSVNGGTGSSVSATGSSWGATAPGITVHVALNAGSNTVKFYNNTAFGPDMDYITVGP
ncbi:MAG TPA: hypothetical protein VFA71_00725 [Terriglobales bacterium]|nr:hypothetical protein [Terriglobales bacterium]